MTQSSPPDNDWYADGMERLLRREDVSPSVMERAIDHFLKGIDPAQGAAFLTALHLKGESPDELSAAVRRLRKEMTPLDRSGRAAVDTCGTGGDGAGVFNISTAVALVTAATGVPVIKHGNRAVSSRSGSSDLLRELGLKIEAGPEWSRRCFDRHNFAFCYAPHFHPALAAVAPLRRSLGFRTLFNLLGPLLNPAGAEFQLLGVGKSQMLDPMAAALVQLGSREAFVVHGRDGLDEISLSAPTDVRHIRDGRVTPLVWTADAFGLAPVSLDELRVDGPQESAALIRRVIAGESFGPTRIVIANSAAAIRLLTGCELLAGVARATEAIQSGAVTRLLTALVSEE